MSSSIGTAGMCIATPTLLRIGISYSADSRSRWLRDTVMSTHPEALTTMSTTTIMLTVVTGIRMDW
jgi:hypothetical protein